MKEACGPSSGRRESGAAEQTRATALPIQLPEGLTLPGAVCAHRPESVFPLSDEETEAQWHFATLLNFTEKHP